MATEMQIRVYANDRKECAEKLMRFAAELLIDGHHEDHERTKDTGAIYGCGEIEWKIKESP